MADPFSCQANLCDTRHKACNLVNLGLLNLVVAKLDARDSAAAVTVAEASALVTAERGDSGARFSEIAIRVAFKSKDFCF